MVPSPNNTMVQIPKKAMIKWSWETLAANWMGKQAWGWTEFFDVFIVLFPAVTGVMAGANYSGDLADPGKSIGPGTLAAIAFSVAIYLLLAFLAAGTVDNDILRDDLNVMEHACILPAMIVVGVFSSTLSSAIGNLMGSGRILQALARDKLIRPLHVFAYGSEVGDEPRVAILLSWFIAQSAIMIGSLNLVAEIISNFYLLVCKLEVLDLDHAFHFLPLDEITDLFPVQISP